MRRFLSAAFNMVTICSGKGEGGMGDAGRAANRRAVREGLRGAGNSGGRERRVLCNGHPADVVVDGGLMLRRGFVPAAAAADSSPAPETFRWDRT